MRPRHRLALALIPVLVTSCASEEPQSAVAQAREVRPVDPDTDNRAVTSQLTPGLVIQLEIDRNTVRLADAQLVLVPRQTRQGREGERVIVSGWRGGQQVTTVSIPDQRINSQENVGIVIREQRTLSVALPLPRRIEAVEVTLPGGQPQRFDVTPLFDSVCQGQPSTELCR
jgi:hypothetical protein